MRLAAVCVDDRQDASECIRANGEKALLAFRIRVFRGQRQWIGKNDLGISESNPMAGQIRVGFLSEPPRVSRRVICLSQAAIADSCS